MGSDRTASDEQARHGPSGEELAGLNFEAALRRLEEIVRQLESGDTPLEASIDLYTEAQALRAHCERKLSDAEARIAQLQIDANGEPVGETPFGA
jgi:exodeoxyribonuclease VII small subunit